MIRFSLELSFDLAGLPGSTPVAESSEIWSIKVLVTGLFSKS